MRSAAVQAAPAGTRRLTLTAGMASYLDGGALVASGLAIGGFYVEALELSKSVVGLLLGLQTLAFAVGAVVGGRLGDRFGRRSVLVASLATYTAGVAVLTGAWGPGSLALGVVLSGLAIGADLPSSLALIAEEAPAGRRGRMIVVSQMLWVAGIGVTGLLGLVLADLGVLAGRILFLHLLLVGLGVLVLRVNLRESREWRAAWDEAEETTLRPSSPRSSLPAPRAPVAPAAVAPIAFAIGGYYTLWNLSANTVGQFRPFLWIGVMGGSERGASALVLIGLPLGLAGSVIFMRFVDTEWRRWAIACGLLLGAAGWLAVAVSPTREGFVVLVVCFVLGASLSGEAAYKVWAQELIPTLLRASVQGATMAVARVTAALLALVTPLLATSDSRTFFTAVLAAHLSASAIALWWVPRLTTASGRHIGDGDTGNHGSQSPSSGLSDRPL